MMGELDAIEVDATSDEHSPCPHSALSFGSSQPLSELSRRIFRLP